jgi:hypothetical protein
MSITARLVFSALALTSLSGLAAAQTSATPDQPALKGPSVPNTGVPGENRPFGEGKAKAKDRMGSEIPHRLFMKALDALRGDSADASVRLTSEQDSKIKAIDDAFMATVTQYRDAHRDEAKALIQQLSPEDRRKAMAFFNREARGLDDKAPKLGDKAKKGKAADTATDNTTDQPVDPKVAAEAKAKLRELFQGAPKPGDTHAQIFGVLNDPQKAAFQKSLDSLRKDMQDRAGQKRLDRKASQKKGAGETKPAPSTSSDVNVPSPDSK